MSGENKFFTGLGILTLILLLGGYLLVSKQGQKLSEPLLGKEIQTTANHVPTKTKIDYNSNPPAGGDHYGDSTTHAGFYDKEQPDGYLVHSLEHGAIIFWYNPKLLSKTKVGELKKIFEQTSGKTIMTPSNDMDTPLALSSWGRVLKLKTFDEKQIMTFFKINHNRGPEQAPI